MNLRPYQVEAVQWLLAHGGRGLLDFEPGLGKTAIALTAIRALGLPRVLVLSPKVACGVWMREAREWLPGWPVILFDGNPKQRAELWQEYLHSGGLMVTNFAKAEELRRMAAIWPVIIIDESHQVRNRKTALFSTLKGLSSHHLIALTGSPIVNMAADLWTQLHLVQPRLFTSFWRWANNFLEITDDGWGKRLGPPLDPQAFQVANSPFILRREKSEVLKDLPAKTRQQITFQLSLGQRALYDDLVDDMMANLDGGGLLLTPNTLSQMTRLRQITINPALVGDRPASGAFDALIELAESDFDAGKAILVFTPFAQAIPMLQDLFADAADCIITIQGGLSSTEIAARVEQFQIHPSKRKVLIATIGMGTSWTATAASSIFFLGSSWTPATNIQCEDRAHRLGQRDHVVVRYLVGEGTVDEHLLEILDEKATWAGLALDPKLLLRPDGDRRVQFVQAAS